MTKILFFDMETTGLNSYKNGIHQLAGCIEIAGSVRENFNFKMKPMPGKEIEAKALAVSGLTEDDLEGRMPGHTAFQEFRSMLDKHVDKFNKNDKIFLAGYNNAAFDNQFLRQYFTDNGEKYFGSYFWPNSIDVMVLATEHTKEHRVDFPNFQLGTVAKMILGNDVEKGELHDADYDIILTRAIYNKIRRNSQFVPAEIEEQNDLLAFAEKYNEWLLDEGYADSDLATELPQGDLTEFVTDYLKTEA